MDSDSQESPRMEQDWAESPALKTLWRSSFRQGLGDWEVTSLPSADSNAQRKTTAEYAKITRHFFPSPKTHRESQLQCTCSPAPLLYSTAALHSVLSCPKVCVLPPLSGVVGRRTRTDESSHGHVHMHLT